MSVSKRLLARRNKAELSSVQSILSTLGEEDYFGRLSLESRMQDLQGEIADADKTSSDTRASAALYFGGQPVMGSTGIESGFGGAAVSKFQDLVAKLLIDERDGLGQRGPLPAHDDAKLHITDVLRGSFGFLLEEVGLEDDLWGSPLKGAVAKATHLLETFSDQNEEAFEQVLETTDQRSLATANDFFALLAASNATMRLVTEDDEMQVDAAAVERARQRALTSTVSEKEEIVDGLLGGLLPQAHMFELLVPPSSDLIAGKVTRAIGSEELAGMLTNLLNKPVTATLKVRQIIRSGSVTRTSYTLTSLESRSDEPERVYLSQF